uniref:Cytochrome b n=1 Tax=Megachile sculpturalis TaxID=1004196 RepID=A0A0M4LBQ8_9HYME|nr:cytochrome b [Megachile sculpturalis]
MFIKIMKNNKLLNIMNNSVIILPTPVNINYFWNFGSLLGMFLLIQLITGLLLSMNYCPNMNMAFYSIINIMKNINSGWLIRDIHMNGASFYFLCMYMHISRNIYYHCYLNSHVWNIGILILFMSMGTAFMGYVLPWGQMSFWGATVITNLISAVPYIGDSIVLWIWGGFSINNATLNRFFSFHFIFPLMIFMMVIMHLFFLHMNGSSNPFGTNSNIYKIPFNPYFIIKDLIGFILMLLIFLFIILEMPYYLSDPDNFIPANPMNTPPHIKPEWYFLFAYSILRCIPNKLGGVLALFFSIFILFSMPMMKFNKLSTNKFLPNNQVMFWLFINSFIMLTWLGGQNIEVPFIYLNMLFTNIYFLFFFINPLSMKLWEKSLFKNVIIKNYIVPPKLILVKNIIIKNNDIFKHLKY